MLWSLENWIHIETHGAHTTLETPDWFSCKNKHILLSIINLEAQDPVAIIRHEEGNIESSSLTKMEPSVRLQGQTSLLLLLFWVMHPPCQYQPTSSTESQRK